MTTQPSRIPQSAVPAPALSANPTRRGWLARNWKWLLATLFLGGLVLMVGLFALIMGAIRSSDVAKASVAMAQSNRRVLQRLGSPIKEGWLISGSVNVSNGSGDADLTVPISGPSGKGTVYVTAHKSAGTWNYSVMQVAIEGGDEKIDLISGEPPPVQSQPNIVSSGQQADTANLQATSQPATPTTVAAAVAEPSTAMSSASAAAASDVIQSQDTNTSGVVGEMIQCKRSEGVLSIKVRFRNSSSKESRFYIVPDSSYEKVYVTAASKKYFILKDSENAYLTPAADYACGSPGVCARLGPGDSYTWWAKFPAPAADVKKLNLMTPAGPPFEDVPITDK